MRYDLTNQNASQYLGKLVAAEDKLSPIPHNFTILAIWMTAMIFELASICKIVLYCIYFTNTHLQR